MISRRLLVSALIFASTGCASKKVDVGSSDETPRANRDRNLITQAEMDANLSLKASSALDMIKSLRPQYFNDRGTQTVVSREAGQSQDPEAGLVHASVNGGRIVAVAELAELHGNEVLEVRYLNVSQAMQRFGTAARSGPIILVVTAKQ